MQLKPRLAISVDQAQTVVRRMSPHAAVLGVTELHGGEISTVIEIALADAAPCILKVYPESLQWKMAKEVYVLGLLQDLGTSIPKILLADDTRTTIDLNYLLMTRLDGTVLGRREATLSEAELFAIYAEMGAALRGINDVTLDGLLAGYGTIARPDWQQTLDLYRMYCTLELWCWMAQIGKHEALADLTRELANAA